MKQLIDLLKSKFARNAFWLIGSKIYHMAVNLVVSLMMARYLGPSNYGLINYASSFTAMATCFCTLGINGILVNELLNQKSQQGRLLGSTIGMRLLASGLSVLAIIGIVSVMNPEEPLTIQVVTIYSLSLMFHCFDSLNLWYQSRLESKVQATIAAAGYTVVSIYKIWLLVTEKDVLWFAASHCVEFALVAVLLLCSYQKRRESDQPLCFSWKTGMNLLSGSYHFILSGMMVAIYGQMDRIMLKSMLDEASVGYYSAAVAICSMWPFVISALIDSARPLILPEYGRDQNSFRQRLIVLYGTILYVSFAAATMLTVFAKPIILLLYGQAYIEAAGALSIVSWYTAFSYLGVARSIWIVANGKQKYEKYIAGSGALSNLILNWLLIPQYGIKGAAFATLMTQIVTNFLIGFLFPNIRENNILILRAFIFWRYLPQAGKDSARKEFR